MIKICLSSFTFKRVRFSPSTYSSDTTPILLTTLVSGLTAQLPFLVLKVDLGALPVGAVAEESIVRDLFYDFFWVFLFFLVLSTSDLDLSSWPVKAGEWKVTCMLSSSYMHLVCSFSKFSMRILRSSSFFFCSSSKRFCSIMARSYSVSAFC